MSDATVIIPAEPKTGTQTPLGLPRRVVILACALVTLFVCGVFAYGLPPTWAQRYTSFCGPTTTAAIGWARETCATFFIALDVIYFGFFLIVSIVLFSRKPGERMTTYTALAMLLFGAASPSPIIEMMLRGDATQVRLGTAVFISGMGALLLFFFTFPDGRYAPAWTRPLAILTLTLYLIWIIVPALNPFLNWQFEQALALVLLLFAVSAFSQIVRYRRYSTPAQQQQTKIMIFGSVCALLGYALVMLTDVVLSLSLPSTTPRVTVALIAYTLQILRYVTLILIPISLTIALLRYRLWEIDLFISRTVTGGAISVVLVIVFIGAVLLVQQLAMTLTGGEQSTLAVAVASVAVALTFNPLRVRLTRVIDQRFYPKYLEKVVRKEQEAQKRLESVAPGTYGNRMFGVYEVIELIGRGGMAEVWRGRHSQLDRPVAIKILPATLADREDFRKRFEREAQTVARLRHTNIVQLYDFGVQDQTYYMVMEYLAGQTLTQHIQAGGTLPFNEAAPILTGLADALDYAHAQGVVHRDVKPSNIILQPITTAAPGLPTVRPILMDFGIARLMESSSGLTNTGTLGTLDYIAPEQILSSATADARADVYALGVIAYQMLTGQLPFTGANAGALVLAHLQKAPPDPRKINPQISEATARAILRALAKEPRERFSSAGEFVNGLQLAAQPVL